MTQQAPTQPDPARRGTDRAAVPPCHVAGIGASAGGLAALRTLFASMPDDPGVAFVVVMHLSPERGSNLVELLQPHSKMPVRQVTQTVPLEPNCVYVIPPNANLDAIDTQLRLSKLETRRAERAPIDHFFRTLAATHDGGAVAVVLTGAGSDGALGLRRVREHGGLTIAQDPAEAEHASMPRSAIATGMIDLVLPLRDIAGAIVRFCATPPRLPVPDDHGAIEPSQAAVLDAILARLRSYTGQELGVYRRDTLLKRIHRRMRLRHVETLAAYLETIRDHRDERRALADDLLLTVADFFADAEIFARLENRVIPRLFERKPTSDERLRVWVVGCSTGEEAYSIVMLLLEAAARRTSRPRLRVFASDLSESALAKAREGVYPEEVAASVSRERLERFFVHEQARYFVRRELRDIVVFTAHNAVTDPPFAHVDLVVCRNFLSELQPDVRREVLGAFHYALEPHGSLLLGTGESIDTTDLFLGEDAHGPLFRPRQDVRRQYPRWLKGYKSVRLARSKPGDGTPDDAARNYGALHAHLAERHGPASILIDARHEVVHFSPQASQYVHLPGGEPTRELVKLVPEPLRARLRAGLVRMRHEGGSWRSEPITVQTAGGPRRVAVRAEPVVASQAEGLSLVVFEELADGQEPAPEASTHELNAAATISALEAELERTQRQLRGFLEEQEVDRGALESTVQELQSANEELQLTLEELETSKVELQSSHEELKALDEENRRRVKELAQLSNDLKNLLESTGIATLFLDSELRIVRFTPPLGELLRVRAADAGRPLAELDHGLRYPELEQDARRVYEDLAPIEREVTGERGNWYIVRLLPYRKAGEEVAGVVVSLIDITARKRAEEQLRETDRRKDEFLATVAHELRNPLAPISAGLDVLGVAGHDPRAVEKVRGTMARQTKQLVRLVDDLIDVARLSGGRLRLRRSPVALADVVRDAVEATRPLIDAGQHELTLALPDAPIVLDADAARLVQVLTNLLSNAARYTPSRGRITVTAARNGDTAVVSVADSGIGIPDDMRERIFDLFARGGDEREGYDPGLGLGLALAKSLVELHGGSIEAISGAGDQGSEFRIRLPILREERERPPVPAPHGPAEAVGGRRVLIVDDNADVADALGLLVQMLGRNDVRTVTDGTTALAAAEAFRPDIVFLDLRMPNVDGYEIARRIRREPWGERVMLVALTGWAQDEHRRRTAEAGFDQHLAKPADRASLEAVLARAGGGSARSPSTAP